MSKGDSGSDNFIINKFLRGPIKPWKPSESTSEKVVDEAQNSGIKPVTVNGKSTVLMKES